MSHFTERQLAYLRNQGRLGHIATVAPGGTRHVLYLDVAPAGRAAFVVDDLIEERARPVQR